MNEEVEPIAAFLREAEIARQKLGEKLSTTLRLGDIEDALLELEGFEKGPDLLYRSWAAGDIIDRLEGFDFSKFYPEALAVLDLPDPIVPPGTRRSLEERIVKISGERWHIHKNDADPFPSNPHAHNYEDGLKLSLADGGLYRKKERVSKIDRKKLLEIRSRLKDIQLPDLTI